MESCDLEELSCPSCGSCSFLGTANTMCSISEALGMTLTGGALIPAVHPDRLRMAVKTGEAICDLIKNDITARDIINKQSLENAVKVTLGISGSTNTVIHLTAIAHEAEADIDIMKAFEKYSKNTPQVAKVNPAAKWDMEAFWQAGGIPKVMESLKNVLNLDVITGNGKTLKENLEEYKYCFPENKEIIKSFEKPFDKQGGLAVLRGNLAPDTAVSKPGAIDPSQWYFKGEAKVFDSEEEAEKAILNNKIKAGDIVVIRYEGPKGGPVCGRCLKQ
ncbi:MAG: dihydroxy-acid dehydratase [Halanaerobiales bacterium]|nr:dihydroxy-acid dehydratase [Halanaerobiales bacterium]